MVIFAVDVYNRLGACGGKVEGPGEGRVGFFENRLRLLLKLALDIENRCLRRRRQGRKALRGET